MQVVARECEEHVPQGLDGRGDEDKPSHAESRFNVEKKDCVIM